MRPGEKLLRNITEIEQLAKQFHIHELRIYGSVARGSDTESSDLDLLAIYDDNANLFFHAAFNTQISQLLDVECDIQSDEILSLDAFKTLKEDSITLQDFVERRFLTVPEISKEERNSSSSDNLEWIIHRIGSAVQDESFESFVNSPELYDSLAYQFMLLGSILSNSAPEDIKIMEQKYSVDLSGWPVLQDLLLTTMYPRLIYKAARCFIQDTSPNDG